MTDLSRACDNYAMASLKSTAEYLAGQRNALLCSRDKNKQLEYTLLGNVLNNLGLAISTFEEIVRTRRAD